MEQTLTSKENLVQWREVGEMRERESKEREERKEEGERFSH